MGKKSSGNQTPKQAQPNPNYPSKTENPSGKGRGNKPK